MSEQGWREFLAAEGIDDWVVLHGGATAVFRVLSLGEAAQLAGDSVDDHRWPSQRAVDAHLWPDCDDRLIDATRAA
jgi:hypothetical protein